MLDEIKVEGTDSTLVVSTVTCNLNTVLNQLLLEFSTSPFPDIYQSLQNIYPTTIALSLS